jgi:hypothetical protein
MRVALGFKARTGRAALVAIAGDSREPQFVERAQIQLLPDGAFAPYHAAEGLEPQEAHDSVERSVEAARRLARTGIQAAARRLSQAGHELCGCAVLIGPGMPDWSTADILAVHVRMHQAEGEMFRNVLVDGVRACELPLHTLREKYAMEDATKLLGVTRAQLGACLAALGKAAGPPWGKDQKEAAAAALVALSS